jgi:DNA-binding transcriptional regulator YiaG
MAKKEKKEPLFRIGAVLAENNVSSVVFAKLMKVNLGTVSEWINHKVYPEPYRLPLMSQILNVNIQDLLIPTKIKEGKSIAETETEKHKAQEKSN